MALKIAHVLPRNVEEAKLFIQTHSAVCAYEDAIRVIDWPKDARFKDVYGDYDAILPDLKQQLDDFKVTGVAPRVWFRDGSYGQLFPCDTLPGHLAYEARKAALAPVQTPVVP